MVTLLPVHIVAGGLAMVLGAAALLATKGGAWHRTSGLLFVYAMLIMGISASILALRRGLGNPNLLGGLTCVYFVITALATVKPATVAMRRLDLGATGLAFVLAMLEIGLGIAALSNPQLMNGLPGPMLFFMAAITLVGGIGDLRVRRSGRLRGAPRLRRHLWRMCFALFLAAGSFFSIRARVARILPEPFLSGPMRAVPIALVFLTMFYWLWRLRHRNPGPVAV